MKILVTPTSFSKERVPVAWALLASFASEIVVNPTGKPLSEKDIPPLLAGVDGWIAGLDFITAEALQDAPDSLKVISRYGVGVERVDLAATAEHGISVTNTPGVNAEAVADLTLGLMLAVARRIPVLDRQVKAGAWPRTTGMEMPGKTLGILGLGAIGKAVAKRAQGFSMRILAHDPWLDAAYAEQQGIRPMGLDELLAESDIVSLHLPLTAETENILCAERIARMKPGAILINTARGGLADETALLANLVTGHLGGLGLDAFAVEPPGDSPLFRFDNVVVTPHVGAHTPEATANMAIRSVENLMAVLTGHQCPYIVR